MMSKISTCNMQGIKKGMYAENGYYLERTHAISKLLSVCVLTLMLLQLASRICASCEAGVRLACEPNGEIIDDIARFSFEGVLLNESARPTWTNNIDNNDEI